MFPMNTVSKGLELPWEILLLLVWQSWHRKLDSLTQITQQLATFSDLEFGCRFVYCKAHALSKVPDCLDQIKALRMQRIMEKPCLFTCWLFGERMWIQIRMPNMASLILSQDSTEGVNFTRKWSKVGHTSPHSFDKLVLQSWEGQIQMERIGKVDY